MANISEQYKTIIKEFPVLQEKAMAHFSRLGFPTPKNEEWKYTNISPIVNHDFSLVMPDSKISKEEILWRFPFVRDSVFVVTENGKINSEASNLKNLPAGIEIKNLRDVKNLPLVQKHFNLYVDVQEDAFAALNTAFVNDGLVILISKNAMIENPVYVINISSSIQEAVNVYDRLLAVAEKNSQMKISNIVVSKDKLSEIFVNSQVEVFADENSSIEFDVLQNENAKSFHINGTHVYQSANSKFSFNTVSLGGSILRNKLHIKLDGTNCETHMHGLYVAADSQLIDNHTAVYHSKPNCNSNQLYKGIIGGKAHGVFNGKIMVEKDAQKTNAYQSNKNILLSNAAVVNTKPQLEIFADDIKCTHGATTGQMDDESLFYLRSRGINENNAKALLNLAFADDVLNKISDEKFRKYIHFLVEQKLKNDVQ
ncbi:MAG TPA: Fe-S cluster assembly protein SufD [Bacteroidia bacterium]|nr:Fe-S cluster assembly protein SufD [Bacteroidia bacterium]